MHAPSELLVVHSSARLLVRGRALEKGEKRARVISQHERNRTLQRRVAEPRAYDRYVGQRGTHWPGQAELDVELTGAFMDSLSLTAARPRDRRAALARAGKRIVDVDPRYVQIEVDRASGDENHRLRVVRRDEAADELAAAVVD